MSAEWARINGVSRRSSARWFCAGALPAATHHLAAGTIPADEAQCSQGAD